MTSASLKTAFSPYVPVGVSNPKPDYPEGVWLPWQTDYVPPANLLVPLVGAATALGPVDASPSILNAGPNTPGRPDGRVSLPKVRPFVVTADWRPRTLDSAHLRRYLTQDAPRQLSLF